MIVGNRFAMELRGTTTTSLLASGNSRNESLLIASIILSQQTQGLRKITYLPLMTLITKALCLPVGASTIPFIILSTILDITIATALTTAIDNTASKEVELEGRRYNRAARGY